MKQRLKSIFFVCLVGGLAACTAVGERTVVSVGYYSVAGETFEELDQDIQLHGPNVLGVGKALASTDLRILPRIQYSSSRNDCKISAARVNVTARVTLPRHRNERALKQELANAWNNLKEYAKVHEAVHVAIADRYALKMEDALLALKPSNNCIAMREIARVTFSDLFKQHHQEQLAFDESEKRRIRGLLAQN